jgi:hypothetical protein
VPTDAFAPRLPFGSPTAAGRRCTCATRSAWWWSVAA